jgi:hypothetical protein
VTRQLTINRPARASVLASGAVVMPGVVADAGERASRRFLEFFAASIRNRNTRMARWWVRLHEKGRKRHEMPAHHDLARRIWMPILKRLAFVAIRRAPLFRSAHGHTGVLAANCMNRVDAGAWCNGAPRRQD